LNTEAKLARIDTIPEFLREICRNTDWPASTITLSFVLYSTAAKEYRLLKSIFALPSVYVIYEWMGQKIDFRERGIFKLDEIGGLNREFRDDDIVFAILAVDATVFDLQMLI
jgi:hypothetical protein